MRSFLDQPGLPLVHTQLSCTNNKASLRLSQSRYLPYGSIDNAHLQWKLPVCVRFERAGKSARQCFVLDQPRRDFAVEGGCADWYLPNADAAGYYRFAMADPDFSALRTQLAALTPVERVSYADAISSAFIQGKLSPEALLDAVPTFAGSDIPQVATALLPQFAWIREYLASDATRPALDAFASALFGSRTLALGMRRLPTDTDMSTQLRVRLVEFLAFTAHDRAVRQSLNELGRSALGLDAGGSVDLMRVDPDLRGEALKVAVQDSGEPAFKAVLGELAVNHQTRQRYELLAALGATHDPLLGEQARNYALTPAVPVGEFRFLYQSQVAEPENRAAFWQWLQANFDSLAARLPDQVQSSLIRLAAAGACSKSQSEQLRLWFTPRLNNLIGGERILSQSLEAIDQCTALREHFGEQSLTLWARAHASR